MGELKIRPTTTNEFWINESFVELLSYYIAKAFEQHNISSMTRGAQEVYEDCTDNVTGTKVGMVYINFDRHIISEDEKSEMIAVLEGTKTLIAGLGKEISVEDLNVIENLKTDDYFKRWWTLPVKTSSLIGTIDIIEKALKGEWKEPNNYGVWFQGYPHPKGAKTI